MKVKELIAKLQKLDPEALVVYSIDDEGNAFHSVQSDPSTGIFNEADHEFIHTEQDGFTKAVCIN